MWNARTYSSDVAGEVRPRRTTNVAHSPMPGATAWNHSGASSSWCSTTSRATHWIAATVAPTRIPTAA